MLYEVDPDDSRHWFVRGAGIELEYRLEEPGGELESRHRLGDHSVEPVWWCEDPDDGSVVEVLDPNDQCNEYPPCGGCSSCMIAQAEHGGYDGCFYGYRLEVKRAIASHAAISPEIRERRQRGLDSKVGSSDQ